MSLKLNVDWPTLKGMAKEFLDALPTLDEPGIDNGLKLFNIAMLGFEGSNADEEFQSWLLFKVVHDAAETRLNELEPCGVLAIPSTNNPRGLPT